MNEDTRSVRTMRTRMKPREPHRSFMVPDEVVRLRTQIIRVTQDALASELLRPDTGSPVSKFTVCRWERGRLAVPLWAARRLRQLAQSAHLTDTRGDDGDV